MLKYLALLIMTIDHIGYYFYQVLPYDVYIFLRCVGRLAFPIFALFIVAGFHRTKDRFHYLIRMGFWAVIAHFSIAAASTFTGRQASIWVLEWSNVMVLFTFAIIMLMGYDLAMRSYHDMIVSMTPISDTPLKMRATHYDVKVNIGGISLSPQIGIPVGITAILISFWAVFALKADYEFYGLLTVLFIYITYDKETEKVSAPTLLILLATLNVGYILIDIINRESFYFAIIQSISIISVFLFNYFPSSKKKPNVIGKYLFYLYYPLHIVTLILLARYWDVIIKFFAI